MNNPHQALIEETKLKLVNTFVLSDDSWDVILQATIDTVLERERERILKIISEEMSRGTMFGNKDEDIAYTLTSKLKKSPNTLQITCHTKQR